MTWQLCTAISDPVCFLETGQKQHRLTAALNKCCLQNSDLITHLEEKSLTQKISVTFQAENSFIVITQTLQVPFNSPFCFLLAAPEAALQWYKELTILPFRGTKENKRRKTRQALTSVSLKIQNVKPGKDYSEEEYICSGGKLYKTC